MECVFCDSIAFSKVPHADNGFKPLLYGAPSISKWDEVGVN